jgi:serine/threonine transporter
MKSQLKKWNQVSLVKQIIIGMVIGIILAVTIPEVAKPVVILGSLFVGALKAIAPVLVLFWLCQPSHNTKVVTKQI